MPIPQIPKFLENENWTKEQKRELVRWLEDIRRILLDLQTQITALTPPQ